MTAPLRFLAGILACWTCLRAAAVAPWPYWQADAQPPPVQQLAGRAARDPAPGAAAGASPVPKPLPTRPRRLAQFPRAEARVPAAAAASPPGAVLPQAVAPPQGMAAALPLPLSEHPVLRTPAQPGGQSSRWSLSAWAHVRSGGGTGLAQGGSLGGSQAGLRIGYRINGSAAAPVTAFARLYAPASRPADAEAALGVEWKPFHALPVRIAAERRQALGREGRSAFSLLAHGGVAEAPLGAGFRLDAYGQAGVVGIASRDLFADGAARVTRRIGSGSVRVGAGAWAAAQPGASRGDIGPTLLLAIPTVGMTIAADWRLPVAGAAEPRSGPAVTLSTAF